MIEIGQSLELLCSNLTVETGLIPLGASAQVTNCDGFFLPDSRSPRAQATQILPLRL